VASEFHFYLGVDWATEQHQACIMDSQGQVLAQRKIEHSGKGIVEFIGWMEELAEGQVRRIAVALEVPRGPLVEAFLEHQWAVFSINPKQLDRFRDRHTVAGAKDDSRDAFVLGDSLPPISTVFAGSRSIIPILCASASCPEQRRTSRQTCAAW
jgi:hypothetical protein